MFERFTDQARRAVVLARDEARRLDHQGIGPEHVVLGLLHDRTSAGGWALVSLGAALASARASLAGISGGAELRDGDDLPLTPETKKLLEAALREALRLGRNDIGTEHLALALSRDTDSTVARLLSDIGVEPKALRARVLELPADRAEVIPRRDLGRGTTSLQLSPRAQDVLSWSARQALELGVAYVGRRSASFRLLRHAGAATRGLRALASEPTAIVPAVCSRCGTRSPTCGTLFVDATGALVCERCTGPVGSAGAPAGALPPQPDDEV